MKPDPNYPRWMFHASRDPVIIYSKEEEDALGAEWSRTIAPPPPPLPPEPPKPRRGRPPHKREDYDVYR